MLRPVGFLLGCAALLLWLAADAAQDGDRARLALVIDDLGNTLDSGRRALALPGAVTYAFLPQTPYARPLAEQARDLGKEVMLHLPMQAEGDPNLGPDALTMELGREVFRRTWALPWIRFPTWPGSTTIWVACSHVIQGPCNGSWRDCGSAVCFSWTVEPQYTLWPSPWRGRIPCQ